MHYDYYTRLIELIKKYIKLLDEEYSVISELLGYNMGTISYWEEIQKWYVERLEQIKKLRERNYDVIKTVEHIDSLLGVACSVPSQIGKKESSHSALNSLQLSDDEDVSAVADAIAALQSQLIGGGEAMVNVDGTILNPSDSFPQCDSGDGLKPIDMAVAAGDSMPSIQVPPGKLAGGYGMCRICGKIFSQITNYCPECGTKVVIEKPVVALDKVQFSAIAPKTFVKGNYSVIEIFMYEEASQNVVQEAIANADDPVKETKSGMMTAEREAKITVTLSSPDFVIEDNTESQIWQGDYLSFRFAIEVPEQYKKY